MTENNLVKTTGAQSLAILLMTFCWFFEAPALGSALGVFPLEYPDISKFEIQLAWMGPYVTAMIFSPIAGRLALKYEKKNIALIGLATYFVFGTLPFFVHSFSAIIVLRLLTGIGVGLVMPIPNAYIYERYVGAKRNSMLGYTSAFSNGATIIAAILSGYLVVWFGGSRGCFLLFILIGLILLYCVFCLPKSISTATEEEIKAQEKKKTKMSELPKIVWLYMLFVVLLYITFSFVSSNFSLYVIGNGWGDAAAAGWCLSAISAGAIIGGLIYGPLLKATKKWFNLISLILFGIAYIMFILANGIGLLAVGGVFAGVGSALILPYWLGETAKKCNPEEASTAYGFVTGGINVGAILCPIVQAAIGGICGNSDLPLLSIITVVLLAVCAIIAIIKRNSYKEV